ncbi:argininosuccinate synthase-related protein [Mesorhizobium abyssinicae]|uniref:argininosuccinate synthase-related protein n=1 Tax=Mesorhizobium abyssinicae TaxID=1209958 RepID=UPI00339B968D
MNPILASTKRSIGGISSFEDLEAFPDRTAPVATMFSGGLDSTYLLYKLQSLGFGNIEAVAVDVGTRVDQPSLERTAAMFGARFVCLEGRGAFVEQGVKPAIRAHAKYLGDYPLSSSLSRPIIASLVVDHARSIGSQLVLHTANLSQNSLPRLNNSIKRSGFSGNFGSPYECSVISRQQKASDLSKCGATFVADRTWSADENLWCREFESGPLEDPENFSIPEEAFAWTRNSPEEQPEEIKLGFADGSLVSIDDRDVALIDAIAFLNNAVGKFGHGRFVGLEHITTGQKVLEVREAPAAAIILDALRHLENASLDVASIVLKQGLEQAWSQEAVSGAWGSTIHQMCERAIATALEGVSGSVSYTIDHTRFLPRSIVARAPKYIRDRHLWEYDAASHRVSSKASRSRHSAKRETGMENSPPQVASSFSQQCTHHLVTNGWWFSKGECTEACFGIEIDADWKNFADHWDRLLLDEYMRDGGAYRYRRYSAFEYDSSDGLFRVLPHAPYEQSKSVNHLNGGFKRYFEPLELSFIEHPILEKILTGLCRILCELARHDRWNIKIHPYRIVARDGVNGKPAPEGLHQDGVDFIACYMIGRVNVTGGMSMITDASKQFLGEVEMNRPNDFVICNDRETFHDVSSIVAENLKMPYAYRDVLVIAFEKL